MDADFIFRIGAVFGSVFILFLLLQFVLVLIENVAYAILIILACIGHVFYRCFTLMRAVFHFCQAVSQIPTLVKATMQLNQQCTELLLELRSQQRDEGQQV
jgi:hypothetical protein